MLVNWLLRNYATENDLHAQKAEFNSASQDLGEDENAFYTRATDIHAKRGYIQPGPQLRARFVQALRSKVRVDLIPYLADHPSIPMQGLVQFARQRRDAVRRCKVEAKTLKEAEVSDHGAEEAASKAERAARRAQPRVLAAAVTSPATVTVVPLPSTPSTPPKASGPSAPKRGDIPHRFPCDMCNSL